MLSGIYKTSNASEGPYSTQVAINRSIDPTGISGTKSLNRDLCMNRTHQKIDRNTEREPNERQSCNTGNPLLKKNSEHTDR